MKNLGKLLVGVFFGLEEVVSGEQLLVVSESGAEVTVVRWFFDITEKAVS